MSAKAEPKPPSHPVLEQAAQWFALLLSGQASAREHAQWQAWLAASEAHRQAWAQVEKLSGRFSMGHTSEEGRLLASAYQQASRSKPRRRQVLLGLAACVGTGGLAWGVVQRAQVKRLALAWAADQRSGTAEVREARLADGSRVWLNAQSAFNHDYQAQQRLLQLLRGEILIETASDAQQRPFYVQTPQGRLQALGTRFGVRLAEAGLTELSLYEGTVQVQPNQGGAWLVQAGEAVRFSAGGLVSSTAAAPAREAWTRGVLVANHMPLSEVVAELSRHFHGHMSLAPELADWQVFGSYPANEPEQALAILATVMPMRIRQPLPWWIRIEPKD